MISSDGGVLLLAGLDKRIGLIETLAALMPDHRNPLLITHSMEDILRARVLAIARGYPDADDLDDLRGDPAFKMACGRLPETGEPLPPQPTISRWENEPDPRTLIRMTQAMVDLWCASHRSPPKAITLDIDDTADTVHGHQQFSLFNAHYDERCFLPIHVYDANTGHCVVTILRPGKTPNGKEVRAHPRRLVRRIRMHWPDTIITMRGDGHYARREVMAWCEANRVQYVLGLSKNATLDAQVFTATDAACVKRALGKLDIVRDYTETQYAAKSWSHPRRVVARIEATRKGLDVRYVATNIAHSRLQGTPPSVTERRTMSFANRKIVLGSTPTTEETSNVLRAYATSDQRVYECPCPECGGFTEILWTHIEWEPDRPETAAFRCPHCAALIAERHKAAMVAQGVWRATRPDVKDHAGFRINALVSPHANASWGKLASEFLTAKDHPDTLQTFVKTILAQGWREEAETVDETQLQARAEPFGLTAIPPEVLIVTAGCDVQDDRIEITYVGWSRDEILILGHAVVWGSPHETGTWAEVDDALRTAWRHPNGGTLKVDAAIVDSGSGGHVDAAYSFTRSRFARRIVAGKGVAGTRPALQASQTKGQKLFLVGVDGLKAEILSRLSRGRSIRFSADLEPVWFEQVTSERRIVRYARGQPIRRFERIGGRRAEALGCLVYAMSARHLVGANLDRRAEELRGKPSTPALPGVIRSAWLAR